MKYKCILHMLLNQNKNIIIIFSIKGETMFAAIMQELEWEKFLYSIMPSNFNYEWLEWQANNKRWKWGDRLFV